MRDKKEIIRNNVKKGEIRGEETTSGRYCRDV